MALTQECVLSFLLEHGGKVKNTELVNSFRSHINCADPAEKQHNRDLFKKLVNSVAVVKQIDEVKFVVVKKRYQDFIKEATGDAPTKTHTDDSFSSTNTSFSYTSPRRSDSVKAIYSDIENNNNTAYVLNINGNYYRDAGGERKDRSVSRSVSSVDATTVKVLNLSGDQASRTGKSGSVFAVIAVKSPPRTTSAPATHDDPHAQVSQHKPAEIATRVPAPSVPSAPAHCPSHKEDASGWNHRHPEEMQPPNFTQAKTQNKTLRQGEDARYSEAVPLEPLVHEWLVKCAAGLWGHIYALLLKDTRLAQKKDFMSGFTALHWAAKDGNREMINKLMDISRKRGTYVNINSKAHGGYTPLHIAAIHGHTEVMLLLVQRYGANVNERDNDGKKAWHYLGQGVSAEVRALVGGLPHVKYREKTEGDEYREQPKGFNTISKLFQPHMGKKQKTSTRFAHEW